MSAEAIERLRRPLHQKTDYRGYLCFWQALRVFPASQAGLSGGTIEETMHTVLLGSQHLLAAIVIECEHVHCANSTAAFVRQADSVRVYCGGTLLCPAGGRAGLVRRAARDRRGRSLRG